MVVEYNRYKIDDSRRNGFEEAYQKATTFLAASVHCASCELSRCTEDTTNYILRIEWDSEEGHLKGFRASPEFRAFFEIVQPYFNDIQEMRHYQVIQARSKPVV